MTDLSYGNVLRTRNVTPLLLSASLTRLASEMILFVVVLFTLQQYHSPSFAGLCGFMLTLPGFVMSPVAGALLDRAGAVPAVVTDVVASTAITGLLAVSASLGWLSQSLLLVLLGLYSLTSPLSQGGVRTLLPRFVAPAAYPRANALDLSTYSCIEVAGPLLGGGLLAAVGAKSTLMVVAALFAAGGLALMLLRSPGKGAPRKTNASREHLLRQSWHGVRYLLGNPTLRGLAVSYSLYQVCYGVLVVTVPVALAQRIVGHGNTVQYAGAVWSLVGLGGAAGALLAGRAISVGRERAGLVIALLGCAVAAYPLSAITSVVTLVIGMALFGLLDGGLAVSVLTLRQRRTDPSWLGRVMTVSISVNLIGFPIGSAFGGVLAAHSVPLAFGVAALAALIGAASGTVLIPATDPAPTPSVDRLKSPAMPSSAGDPE